MQILLFKVHIVLIPIYFLSYEFAKAGPWLLKFQTFLVGTYSYTYPL